MGDTGGAYRLDCMFHLAICISKRKYGQKNTKVLTDSELHPENKDEKKRNTENRLAGAEIHPKKQ